MAAIDRSEPAIPEMNQGAEIISRIGTGCIPIAALAISQLKMTYANDPARNPMKAKESNSLVLSKDIACSPLHQFKGG